jgi:RNA polymerase sigma factor (sigma-70 family)
MNFYRPSCDLDGIVYPEAKKLKDPAAESHPEQSLHSCSICSCRLLIERQLEPDESVFLPNLNQTASIDVEELAAILLPYINDAVRWAYLQYQSRICIDELDDLSQQIILMLIEDNCRRLRSFNGQFSFKTWLQAIVNHYIYKCFSRRKQTEPLDEINPGLLTYSPPQDQDIEAVEVRKLLFDAICKLSVQDRLLYKLWFISEIDAKEIASIFKTEVKIIYKRKQTLVLKLRRLVRRFQSH